jgi:hypothetical protein
VLENLQDLFSVGSTFAHGSEKNLLDTLSGDIKAEKKLSHDTRRAICETQEIVQQKSSDAAKITEKVGTYANVVVIATAIPLPPVAAFAGSVSLYADGASLLLNTIAGDQKGQFTGLAGIALDVATNGGVSAISAAWNAGASRYISKNTGRFINTLRGALTQMGSSAVGLTLGVAGEGLYKGLNDNEK